MILRMRGLPFTTTEQQIREFFSNKSDSDTGNATDDNGNASEHGGILNILLVNRPDGRPSGDAFVSFVDEMSGRRALTKHKNRIGSRYIELFRTTQAEVQQLLNRSHAGASPQVLILVSSLCKGGCSSYPHRHPIQHQLSLSVIVSAYEDCRMRPKFSRLSTS